MRMSVWSSFSITMIIATVVGVGAAARADGIRIGNRVDVDHLAKANSLAVVVEVQKTRAVYRKRFAYGENRRYVSVWRIRVKPLRVLAGAPSTFRKKVWLQRGTYYIPGKKRLVRYFYEPTLNVLANAKRGTKLVLFLNSWARDGKQDLQISDADLWSPALEQRIKRAYAEKLVTTPKGSEGQRSPKGSEGQRSPKGSESGSSQDSSMGLSD